MGRAFCNDPRSRGNRKKSGTASIAGEMWPLVKLYREKIGVFAPRKWQPAIVTRLITILIGGDLLGVERVVSLANERD